MRTNSSLFRKKNIDRITSPEQLQDYVKVTNPSVWLVLLATILFLAGVIVWGLFGSIQTKVSTVAIVSDDIAEISIPSAKKEIITEGMSVTIDNDIYTISKIDGAKAIAEVNLSDNVYNAEIEIESIKPISLLIN